MWKSVGLSEKMSRLQSGKIFQRDYEIFSSSYVKKKACVKSNRFKYTLDRIIIVVCKSCFDFFLFFYVKRNESKVEIFIMKFFHEKWRGSHNRSDFLSHPNISIGCRDKNLTLEVAHKLRMGACDPLTYIFFLKMCIYVFLGICLVFRNSGRGGTRRYKKQESTSNENKDNKRIRIALPLCAISRKPEVVAR